MGTAVFCPRCDREFDSKVTREDSLAILSKHVDKAHPDMDNYIKDEEI